MKPKIVIVGAGFGGLTAAQAMRRLPVDITVIDRKNHHTFQPLLYQVATAGLSPGEIASPIRGILRGQRNTQVLLGEVTGIDLVGKKVSIGEASLPYDYLVLAAGARHSYFGHDEWEAVAPGLKTIEDATAIRTRMLTAFEDAERLAATGRPHPELLFVVIGGGPTGVEMAGTMAEVAHKSMASDFRNIDPRRTRILLLDAGPRILAAYPEDLSASALAQLRKLGVEVRTSMLVTEVAEGMVVAGGETFAPAVTVWAAGNVASPLGKMLGVPLNRAGQVLVEADLSVPGHREVFAIGDMAAFHAENGKLLPGVAPVAMQQGRAVAKMIAADLRNQPRIPFHYHDKGSLATIGRAAAVADFGKIRLSGFLAWVAWLSIHIFFLIGFRNRLLVMIEWAWSYLTYGRSARLITDPPK